MRMVLEHRSGLAHVLPALDQDMVRKMTDWRYPPAGRHGGRPRQRRRPTALPATATAQGAPPDPGQRPQAASRPPAALQWRSQGSGSAPQPAHRYWAQLSLMAGVVAPNAGKEVHTAWSDWYRGPPGQARYMPSLPVLRSAGGLEDFVLQGWMPSPNPSPNPSPSPNPNPNLTKEEYDALFDPWVRCPHNMAADRQAG